MQSVIPTLTVPDIDAAMKFYEDILGFTPTFTMAGPDGRAGWPGQGVPSVAATADRNPRRRSGASPMHA